MGDPDHPPLGHELPFASTYTTGPYLNMPQPFMATPPDIREPSDREAGAADWADAIKLWERVGDTVQGV